MKNITWQAVVLVASVLIPLIFVLGWLSYQGKDATTLLAGVGLVLTALGFGYQYNKTSEIAQSTAKIEGNTNGNIATLTTQLEQQRRDMINQADQHRRDMREMADKLAVMVPAVPEPPVSGAGAYADREHSHSPNV